MRGPPTADRVLLFLHLPKAGGTTLAHILERQYGSDSLLRLYDSTYGAELATLSRDQLDRLRVVMGHFYFGAHRHLARDATYLTMLRDPVERVISHYYYVRGDPEHYLHDLSHRVDLRRYVESCAHEEPNNDQTRLIAGPEAPSLLASDPGQALATARHNLTASFAAVGLMEDFDRSMILFKRLLGWRTPLYVRQNSGQSHPARSDLSSETLRSIETHNELDIELYRDARRLYRERIDRQGPGLDRELRAFAGLQAAYGRAYPVLSVFSRAVRGVS